MQITALIFGVLGALNALVLAAYGYAIGSVFVGVSGKNYGGVLQALSIIIPLMCMIGAGSVWFAPLFGGLMLFAAAAVILGIVGINFISLTTLLLLLTGGGFALAAHVSEQSSGKLRFMVIGRLIGGWIIFFAGVSVLARDLLRWIATDKWAPIALGQLWYDFNRSSLNLVQAVVQRYIHPFLWDPIIVSVLLSWAFAVLMFLGVLLLVVFRRRNARP